MPGERWYITGLIAGLLVLSLAILGFRWGTLAARVPLDSTSVDLGARTQPAAAEERAGFASDAQQPDPQWSKDTGANAGGNSRQTADRKRAGRAGKLNINQATAAQLEELPGIGPVLAARIVAYREAHGAFRDAGALVNVEGIGAGKLKAIEELVYAGPAD